MESGKSRIFESTKSKKILKYYLPGEFNEEYVNKGEYFEILDKLSRLDKHDEFHLVIDYCSGGYVHVARSLKKAIEGLECIKTCKVINASYSASNIVLSAFKSNEMKIDNMSVFMFHDISIYPNGNINNASNYTEKEETVSLEILNDISLFVSNTDIDKYKAGGDIYLLGSDVINNIKENLQESE